MTERTTSIVREHGHICLIHYGETSRRPIVLQWTLEGLAAGEGVVLVDPERNARALLELIGDRDGRVDVVDPAEAYARGDGGRSIVERIVAASGQGDGGRPPVTRVSSPAAYALAEQGTDAYLEFERTLADEVVDGRVSVLCQYDQVLVDDELVAQAAAEHAIVVQVDDLALPALDLRPTDDGVRVSGEIDAANERVVASWMSQHRGRALTLDCANLTFLDVAGFRALTSIAEPNAPMTFIHVSGVPKALFSAMPDSLRSPHVSVSHAA